MCIRDSTYEVRTPKGEFLANAAKASRKDARDAVLAARAAQAKWAGATAYNRGQVLYRVAEVLEGRRAQFVDEIVAQQGVSAATAGAQVDAAVDLWVWYAGWCDKYAQVAGNLNPVSYTHLDVYKRQALYALRSCTRAPAGLGSSGSCAIALDCTKPWWCQPRTAQTKT